MLTTPKEEEEEEEEEEDNQDKQDKQDEDKEGGAEARWTGCRIVMIFRCMALHELG